MTSDSSTTLVGRHDRVALCVRGRAGLELRKRGLTAPEAAWLRRVVLGGVAVSGLTLGLEHVPDALTAILGTSLVVLHGAAPRPFRGGRLDWVRRSLSIDDPASAPRYRAVPSTFRLDGRAIDVGAARRVVSGHRGLPTRHGTVHAHPVYLVLADRMVEVFVAATRSDAQTVAAGVAEALRVPWSEYEGALSPLLDPAELGFVMGDVFGLAILTVLGGFVVHTPLQGLLWTTVLALGLGLWGRARTAWLGRKTGYADEEVRGFLAASDATGDSGRPNLHRMISSR